MADKPLINSKLILILAIGTSFCLAETSSNSTKLVVDPTENPLEDSIAEPGGYLAARYRPGRGGGGGGSGASGKWSGGKKKCSIKFVNVYDTIFDTIYQDKCKKYYKKKCSYTYGFDYENVYKEKCKNDYVAKCHTAYDTVYEKKCTVKGYAYKCVTKYDKTYTTEYKKKCGHNGYGDYKCKQVPVHVAKKHPRKECHQIPKSVCKKIPKKIPKKICAQIPKKSCLTLPYSVPKKKPKKVCKKIPKKKCTSLPVTRARQVRKKVPKAVCSRVKGGKFQKKKHSFQPLIKDGGGINYIPSDIQQGDEGLDYGLPLGEPHQQGYSPHLNGFPEQQAHLGYSPHSTGFPEQQAHLGYSPHSNGFPEQQDQLVYSPHNGLNEQHGQSYLQDNQEYVPYDGQINLQGYQNGANQLELYQPGGIVDKGIVRDFNSHPVLEAPDIREERIPELAENVDEVENDYRDLAQELTKDSAPTRDYDDLTEEKKGEEEDYPEYYQFFQHNPDEPAASPEQLEYKNPEHDKSDLNAYYEFANPALKEYQREENIPATYGESEEATESPDYDRQYDERPDDNQSQDYGGALRDYNEARPDYDREAANFMHHRPVEDYVQGQEEREEDDDEEESPEYAEERVDDEASPSYEYGERVREGEDSEDEDPSDVPKAYDYGEQTEAEHKNVVRGIGPDGSEVTSRGQPVPDYDYSTGRVTRLVQRQK